MDHKRLTKAYIALGLTIILWASAFVGIRIGLQGYSPGGLALLRYGIASICMFALYLFLPLSQKHKPTLWEIPKIFILGVICFAIYNVTLNYGEISVSSGIASFIVSLAPVMMAILAAIFLKERPGRLAWLGFTVSLFGVLIIALEESGNVQFSFGVILILIAALSSAINAVFQKPLLKKFYAIELNTYMIWSGTLAMLIFLPQLLHEIPHAPLSATLSAVYMGIFPGAIAYVLWSYALANITAAKVGSAMYVLPLITTFLGWATIGEIPSILSFLGGLIALMGTVLVQRK